MKEANDHIKKRFSDFEPEVSDIKLEEGWDKMTYFLPAEKKRRPAFYFVSCAGILFVFLAALVSGFVFYNYKVNEKQIAQNKITDPPVLPGLTLNKKDQTKFKNRPLEIKPAEQKIPTIKEQITENTNTEKAGPDKEQPKDAGKYSYKNDQQVVPGNNAVSKSKDIPAPAKQEAGHEKENEELLAITKNGTTESYLNKEKDALEHTDIKLSNDPAGLISETIFLPLYNSLQPACCNDSIKEMPLVNLLLPATRLRGEFKLHLFAGPTYAATSLHDLANENNRNYKTINASAGIALNYQFINKVNVIGQFVLAGNNANYKHTLVQSVDLTGPQSALTNNPEKQYVEAYTNTEFKSQISYNVAAGIGYRAYQDGRFGFTPFVLLNLQSVNYQYRKIHTLGTEKITYLPGSITVPQAAPSGFPLPDIKENATLKTTALVPGLIIDYKLNKKYAIIFRPSYYFQVPNNNGRYKSLFLVKQNTLYLDFGVQLKW